MNDLFIYASRKKLRFNTPIGALSAEDLWELPLKAAKPGQANLDDLALALDKEKESNVKSFVETRTAPTKDLEAKFNIVLHVIEVRKAEAEAAATRRANAARKQEILKLIEAKENEAMAGQSIDDLRKLLAEIDD
jgi:hypothetical protein